MEDKAAFLEQLAKQGLDAARIDVTIKVISDFIDYSGWKEDNSIEKNLQCYCRTCIAGRDDAVERIIALIWYFSFEQRLDEMTYLITLLGTIGVIESQQERLLNLTDSQTETNIFGSLQFPPLGTPQEDYPSLIANYLTRLQQVFTLEKCRTVLAGNHHRIPSKHFAGDIEFFAQCGNIDKFLKWRHEKLINELQEHCESGKLWYEQRITPDVVEFVKNNPEVQSGVRTGNRVYVTKIPYNPDAYLKEKDPARKRYLACHCPFVRASLLDGTKIPSLWCYCTGGYEKLVFDLLFGMLLEVEVLESLLDGASRCRFAIVLPNDAIPKI